MDPNSNLFEVLVINNSDDINFKIFVFEHNKNVKNNNLRKRFAM